jgi:DNA-binding GntR family transcriptional regulator
MPKHAYELVADAIRDRIYADYPPGSPLPSRSVLRAEFGYSDQPINGAMRILRSQGLIETLHGVSVQVVKVLPPR